MVPNGWERKPIHAFGEVNAGRQRSPKFIEGTLRPYLRVANVFDNWIKTTDVLSMPFTDKEFAKYKLHKGDILLNEGQSVELVGRPAMYQGVPDECCFQNTLVRFRPSNSVDGNYALQRFRLCLYDGTFQSIAKKTTSIAHLGVSRFAELELNWPPLPEQRKIAKILSTWDKAITTTEKLIETSKQQKKALMQQLLAGKKRLINPETGKAFEGEWEEVKLIDIASSERYSFTGGPFGSDLKSSDYTESGIRIIQLQNIGDGCFHDSYKIFTSEKKADELSNCNIYPEDIIISKMGDPVARATLIPAYHHRYVMASDGIRLAVDKSKFDNNFILELINFDSFRNTAISKSTGSTRKRIGLTDLKNIKMKVPELTEQQKIASVLTAANKEIEILEAKLAHFKQEKKALMQQLLTGKKRVTLNEVA